MSYESEKEIVLDKSNFIEYWEDTKKRRNNSGYFPGAMSVGTPERGIPSKPVYWVFDDGRKERMTHYFFGFKANEDKSLSDEFVRRITLLSGEVVDV